MLTDTDRRCKYEQALRSCVRDFCAREGRPPNFVDLGTGTGMLARAALEAGARHVTMLDCNADILELAREAMKESGYVEGTDFTIVHGSFSRIHSVPLYRPDEPFDALVSEILGTLGCGESIHQYIEDALPHIATFEGGRQYVIPQKVTEYISLYRDLFEYHPSTEVLLSALLNSCEVGSKNINIPLHCTTEFNMYELHKWRVALLDRAPLWDYRVDRVGGGEAARRDKKKIIFPRPRTTETNTNTKEKLFIAFEWTAELYASNSATVLLKNDLLTYSVIPDPGSRSASWGLVIGRVPLDQEQQDIHLRIRWNGAWVHVTSTTSELCG